MRNHRNKIRKNRIFGESKVIQDDMEGAFRASRRQSTVGNDGMALPLQFFCPLTLGVMKDPVEDLNGNNYERNAIESWLAVNDVSPIDQSPLNINNLIPNKPLKEAIMARMGEDWTHDLFEEDVTPKRNRINSFSSKRETSPSSEKSPRDLISACLKDLSKVVLKDLELNDEGVCELEYGSFAITIEVPEKKYSFYLSAEFKDLTPSPELMKKMLQLNYLQKMTRGGCLSLDPTGMIPVYSYRDVLDGINLEKFKTTLEFFITSCIRFHEMMQAVSTK